MFWTQLATIATIHLLAVMSPGPDLAIVIRNATGYGKKAGILTAIGIGFGILTHCTYVVLGIAVLISQNSLIFTIIKYVGACYMLYLAYMSFKSSFAQPTEIKKDKRKGVEISSTQAFLNGWLTNLLNPNASLFLLTVFTQVVQPNTPVMHQVLFGVEMVIVTMLWFSFVSVSISNPLTINFINNNKKWMDRIMGVVLLLLAIKVIFGL